MTNRIFSHISELKITNQIISCRRYLNLDFVEVFEEIRAAFTVGRCIHEVTEQHIRPKRMSVNMAYQKSAYQKNFRVLLASNIVL